MTLVPEAGFAGGSSLALSGVWFEHSTAGTGVRGVSLEISPGALVGVIGPNGCGKSTLVRLIAGVLHPESGTIRLGDAPRSDRIRDGRIAYVPQAHEIVFPFPVIEVVLAGRSPYTPRFGFETDVDRDIAMECLRAVGISHLADRPVTALSVGERQLVAVARGLAQRPQCLLLDEPTAALDLARRWQVVRVVQRMRSERRLTILFVTHDLDLLDGSFDQVVAMRDGKIVAVGSPREIVREDLLRGVYGDAGVRTRRVEGRTFVWSASSR